MNVEDSVSREEDELDFTILPTQDHLLLPTTAASEHSALHTQRSSSRKEADKPSDEEGVFMPVPKKRRKLFHLSLLPNNVQIIPPPLPTLRRPRKLPIGLRIRRGREERERDAWDERIKGDEASLMVALNDSGVPDAQKDFWASIRDPEYRTVMHIFGRSGLDLRYLICHFILYDVSRRWRRGFPYFLVYPSSKWPAMPAKLEEAITVLRRPPLGSKEPLRDRIRMLNRVNPIHLYSRRHIEYPSYGTPFIPNVKQPWARLRHRENPKFWDINSPFFLDCSNDVRPPPSPMVPMEHSFGLMEALGETTGKVWEQVLQEWKEAPCLDGKADSTIFPEPYLDQHLTRVLVQRAQKQMSEMLDVLFDFSKTDPTDDLGPGMSFGSMQRLVRFTTIPEAVMVKVSNKMRRVFPQIAALVTQTNKPLLRDPTCFIPLRRCKMTSLGYNNHLGNIELRQNKTPQVATERQRRAGAIQAKQPRGGPKIQAVLASDRPRLKKFIQKSIRKLDKNKDAIIYDYRGFEDNFPPNLPSTKDLLTMPIEWKVKIVRNSLGNPTLRDKLVVWGSFRSGERETSRTSLAEGLFLTTRTWTI